MNDFIIAKLLKRGGLILNNSSKRNQNWLNTHWSFLQNAIKIVVLPGVMASLIIPVHLWPSTLSKLVVVIVCGIIYLVLTLINYYRPNIKL